MITFAYPVMSISAVNVIDCENIAVSSDGFASFQVDVTDAVRLT